MQHTFSIELKTGKITARKKSGRCWLFAGLNTIRYSIIENLNLENFELSQTYQMFFDKLEKANYFLDNILEALEEDTDSRIIMWLLAAPLGDGVVPKSAMPETYPSSNSARMNIILTLKLRGYASILRKMHCSGDAIDKLRAEKKKMLIEFYGLCTMFLGVPPDEFTFEYTNKDRWKVENSWSDKYGNKEYFVMSDRWFEEFTYQVVIDKKYLSYELKKALEMSR